MQKMRCSNLLQTTPDSTPDEPTPGPSLPSRPDRSDDPADPDESNLSVSNMVRTQVSANQGLLITLHLDGQDDEPAYCLSLNIQTHKPGCLVEWNIKNAAARQKLLKQLGPGPGYS
jgi:hypothetical protein